MANSVSMRKRVRQNAKSNTHNRMRRSKVRTMIKTLDEMIAKGKKEDIIAYQNKLQKTIDQAVSVGLYKKNTAARMKSSFMTKVSSLK